MAAHGQGIYVILDWVPTTPPGTNLVTEHPEWYARDWKGDFQPDAVVGLGRHHRSRLQQAGLRAT